MDAAGVVGAQNASTAPWKTAQNAVSHSAHTHHRFGAEEKKNENREPPLDTKFRTLPRLHPDSEPRTPNPNLARRIRTPHAESEPRTLNPNPAP